MSNHCEKLHCFLTNPTSFIAYFTAYNQVYDEVNNFNNFFQFQLFLVKPNSKYIFLTLFLNPYGNRKMHGSKSCMLIKHKFTPTSVSHNAPPHNIGKFTFAIDFSRCTSACFFASDKATSICCMSRSFVTSCS